MLISLCLLDIQRKTQTMNAAASVGRRYMGEQKKFQVRTMLKIDSRVIGSDCDSNRTPAI